ncbi:MAG: DUF1624 domain-containing protein [Sphingobacteriaceae bacterium]|nr:MAG: DUF1624 domain-containing protein [Sphingobacteriaceae bacterium]
MSKPAERYLSLDVLRGLTVALMIVVNTPGDWSNIYAPFRHAAWHGFTLTDLVFPTFLFVVGNAISFSQKKFENVSEGVFLGKVFKRTLLIFLIGLFLNAFPFVHHEDGKLVFEDLGKLRVWGVLQRIALCYCVASLLIRYISLKGALLFSAITLPAYWAILYYFGDSAAPYSLEGNVVTNVDLALLPAKNLYQGFGIPFDPEGLLSTLPAISNVIAGYAAGKFIQKNGNNINTVIRLAAAGMVLIIAAQLWNIAFPINKPIWTSPYVFQTVGLGLIVLSVLMLIIEISGYKKWTYFFTVFGKNTLFIYALSGMLIGLFYIIPVGGTVLGSWIYENIMLKIFSGKNASLLFAVSYMLLLWLIGYVMDKKRIYIKV